MIRVLHRFMNDTDFIKVPTVPKSEAWKCLVLIHHSVHKINLLNFI